MKSVEVMFGGVSFVVEGFDDPVEARDAVLRQLREMGEEVGSTGEPDPGALRRALDTIRDRAQDTEGQSATPTSGSTRRPAQPLDEPTLQRMLDSANQQLSTPASARRRESIKNQKAAVAATEAEKRVAQSKKERDATTESFRKDLRDVIGSPGDEQDGDPG